ncbi:uncharacterized protein LOC141653451 [Silene latifolia]|uniref:uncharacterized protein LOC141653451 n=1 Tax=Silene latifolia TaxID=37657 RepID=UPI003D78A58A
MADEAQYDTHKRKYDADASPPLRRRTTGFSDGPPPSQPPPQYGSVPPPAPALDEFAAIKQNIQQLASRALNNSNIIPNSNNNGDAKRSKFDDNPPAYTSNYDSYSDQKPLPSGNQFGSTPSVPASHGYSGSGSKRIEIPNGRVGVIIGKGGETIKYLQNQSGAKIQITRDSEHDPYSLNRAVDLMGSEDQIAKAEQLIHEVIAEAEAGGPGSVSRKMPPAPGSEQFVMKVASNKVGLVIGKGGETIKNIQSRSGAKVQVIPLHPPPGDMSMERTVQIDGTSEQIEAAKQMVYEVTENRNRNSGMGGGYSQQGYQAQPQTNWAPQPPQAQQPGGYGYTQQPVAASQYGQQPYSGYPPQTTSGGYPQNWDPSGAPHTQQAPQSGGYDYYGQQQQPPSGLPADNSGYSYNQPPTSGAYNQQGYSHEYSYVSNPGYGNPTNAPSQGETAQVPPSYSTQGETGQVPPVSQTSQQGYTGQPGPSPAYPTYGTNQPGYGIPPASQPGYAAPSFGPGGYGSGYGPPQGQSTQPANPPPYGQQPQQSPSQTGYPQLGAGQPGYPPAQAPAQPVYSQPDAGAPRPTTLPGSYPPPHGAPPVTPPSYAQQQTGYYGSGYYQPPSYPAEGNGSAATAAATPSPASQPAGAPKTSP